MKKLLLVTMFLVPVVLLAQITEKFTTEAYGATSFSEGGLTFNATGFGVDIRPAYGFDDNNYMMNNTAVIGGGVVGSFTNSSNNFHVSSLWIIPLKSNTETISIYNNVLIKGKFAGSTEFTHKILFNEFNNSSANNYYTFVDLSSYSSYTLDEIEFEIEPYELNQTQYLMIDDFTFTSAAVTPITLADFRATADAGVVELSWETASETNNASFIVYRNNAVLAMVEGAGTTSKTNNYTYTDATVVPGVEYTYVLADVDYENNETKYESKAVVVTVDNDVEDAGFEIGTAYPNPFNPSTVVPVELSRDAIVNAKIYTLSGREIATLVNGTMNAGSHELRINASNMTTGLYLVKVMVEDVVNVQKIAFVK